MPECLEKGENGNIGHMHHKLSYMYQVTVLPESTVAYPTPSLVDLAAPRSGVHCEQEQVGGGAAAGAQRRADTHQSLHLRHASFPNARLH